MKMSIGIDISKDTFDTAFFNGSSIKFETYTYDKNGIQKFKTRANQYKKYDLIITMEATGIYHTRLAIMLYDAGFSVAVVNPLIIKRFGQMKLSRIKTDKADAKLIAEYGFSYNSELYTPEKPQNHQIKQLLTAIDGLKHTITKITCRIKAFEYDPLASELVMDSLYTQ